MQEREVEAGRSGWLSMCTVVPRPEEGAELGANSSASQSKDGGWGWSRDTEGDRDNPENCWTLGQG